MKTKIIMEHLCSQLNPHITLPSIILGHLLDAISSLRKKLSSSWIAPLGTEPRDENDPIAFLRFIIQQKPQFIAEDGGPFYLETSLLETLLQFRHRIAHSYPMDVKIEWVEEFRDGLLRLYMIPDLSSLLSLVNSSFKVLGREEVTSETKRKVQCSIQEIKVFNKNILPIICEVDISLDSSTILCGRFLKYNGNNTKFYIPSLQLVKSISNKKSIEANIPVYLLKTFENNKE